jgi:LAGLIDADG endonuclease/Cytochrome c oxidase subunit III
MMIHNKIINKFQHFSFHLVDPSPWPILTSFSLLNLTIGAVSYMHGYPNGGYILTSGLILTVFGMILWFRDIVIEGTAMSLITIKSILSNHIYYTSKAISPEEIEQALLKFTSESKEYFKKDQFSYYLAGLLEGDGHLSLPAIGNTTLNRILNPRIVFTSHINNLGLYGYIQSELGGIGRFQISGQNQNTLRYIIGDIQGILLFINLIHGKLRTPKNIRFNELIKFLNVKYSLEIPDSLLDTSDFLNNSWFTGFTEADGHFGIKIVESKPKSETGKRSVSENISIKFRLDQRSFDKPNSSSMYPIMASLASFLSRKLNIYTLNPQSKPSEVLSISVTGINNLEFIVNYFNKYPLIGVKGKDFKNWEVVYHMIVSKEHLTEAGRLKIRAIASKMKNNKYN